MNRDVYLICLTDDDTSEALAAIEGMWPNGNHFPLTERLVFVTNGSDIVTTKDIHTKIREHDDKLGCVVVKISNYAGYNSPNLWEWLRSAITR